MTLDHEDIEAIAQRVAELIPAQLTARAELVDARALAKLLGVSTAYVYRHQQELGGKPLGDGIKPPVRFDPEIALKAYRAPVAAPHGRPRRGAAKGNVSLLPVRGPRP